MPTTTPYVISRDPTSRGWIYSRFIGAGLIEGDELSRRHGIFRSRRAAAAAAQSAE